VVLDPITTEVVVNRLGEIAQAMAHALYHSGYSPILRESLDGSAGLTDAAGRAIMGGGGIHFHPLLYPASVENILARYPPAAMREGDCFIVNDPYKSGNSHVPDIVLVAPVFYAGEIIAFAASFAHKPDVGGLVPGSSGAAAREIFHDGLLLPPVRYWTKDGVNPELEAIVRNNSRAPDELVGDIRGQVGAVLLGARRLGALCDEYGLDTVREAMAGLLARTTARLKAEIATWPDGQAECEGWLDHDGADKTVAVRVHVKAVKVGDRLTLDFSASSRQSRGPFNCPKSTSEAAALMAVLAVSDHTIPINSGLNDAVTLVLPPGTLINPEYPATVNNYFPPTHLVHNCVATALGRLNPARAVAPSGLGSGAIAVGYPRDRTGKPAVQYELMKMALGATSEHDGVPMAAAMNQFTPFIPVEILETEYPIAVQRFEVWRDSAGGGRQRGGFGATREYRFLSDCVLTLRTTNYREGSWGVFGGQRPGLARATLIHQDGTNERLDCLETRQLTAGDVVRFDQSGGGGYGDPFARPDDAVLDDVRNGYVSAERAAEVYGVIIVDSGAAVDRQATRDRRSQKEGEGASPPR